MGDPLEHDYTKILGRIDNMQGCSSVDGTEDSDLSQLKPDYNATVACQGVLKAVNGPLSDPLERLPVEIWENIVEESASSSNFSFLKDPTTRIERILLLTSISAKWNQAILSTPKFWTTIEIRANIQDLEAKIHLSTVLSKDLPLSVHSEVGRHDEVWDRIRPYISPQGFRLRSITIRVRSDIDPISSLFNDLPMLEDFQWHKFLPLTGVKSFQFLRKANHIRSVEGLYLTLTHLRLDSTKRIRRLKVMGFWKAILEKLSELKEISYVGISALDDEKSSPPTEIDQLPWRTLAIERHPNRGVLENILMRVSSTLRELQVDKTTLGDLSIIITQCSAMPFLKSLKVNAGGDFRIRAEDFPPSSIEELTIKVCPEEPAAHEENEIIERLFAFLTIWVSRVQVLDIEVNGASRPAIIYACSLENLTSVKFNYLRLPLDETEGASWINSGGYKIKAKEIIFGWRMQYIPIKAVGVSRLEIDMNRINPSILEFGQWHSLRSLVLRQVSGDWKGISLPQVQKISLDQQRNISYVSAGL